MVLLHEGTLHEVLCCVLTGGVACLAAEQQCCRSAAVDFFISQATSSCFPCAFDFLMTTCKHQQGQGAVTKQAKQCYFQILLNVDGG
jgi:hypothetical protein